MSAVQREGQRAYERFWWFSVLFGRLLLGLALMPLSAPRADQLFEGRRCGYRETLNLLPSAELGAVSLQVSGVGRVVGWTWECKGMTTLMTSIANQRLPIDRCPLALLSYDTTLNSIPFRALMPLRK